MSNPEAVTSVAAYGTKAIVEMANVLVLYFNEQYYPKTMGERYYCNTMDYWMEQVRNV